MPVWVACVLAWKLTGTCNLRLAGCTLGAAIAIQIATNFFNDAIDSHKGADTARRLGPTRATASGLLSARTVLAWALGFLLLAVAFGSVLYQARGWPVLVIGGTDDRYTPPAETRALYDAVRGPKRLWWATGADHAAVSHDESPAYRAALLTFLRQAAGRG